MIYTVTLNPALDYWMVSEELRAGDVNRVSAGGFSFGGKGLNVSAVLHKLGMPSVAWGIAAGWTGEALLQYAEVAGICVDFVRLRTPGSLTRVNVKLRGVETTECNAPGCPVSSEAWAAFRSRLWPLESGDVVVLSGSLPPDTPDRAYADLTRELKEKGVRVVVDASGEALREAVAAHPFLVKPNRAELEGFAGRPLHTDTDVLDAARGMQEAGAERVLVSLGAGGAVLLDADGAVYRAPALQGMALQTVGAGDALLAGFLCGYTEQGGDVTHGLRLGTAAAAATVFYGSEATGDEMRRLYAENEIPVERVDG